MLSEVRGVTAKSTMVIIAMHGQLVIDCIRPNRGAYAPIEVMDFCVVHAGELLVGMRIWHDGLWSATAACFWELTKVWEMKVRVE